MTTKSSWMALALASLAGLASAQDRPVAGDAASQRESWDSETVGLFSTLPVQDGGRIKPMDTLAGFKLLKMNGKRSLRTPSGERLGSTAWLLDVLFFPEVAQTYECFLVQNSQVLTALGLEPKKRRDRYSYDELESARSALFTKAGEVNQIESSIRGTVERQILDLANNVHDFEQIISTLSFAGRTLPTDASPALIEIYGPDRKPGLAHVIAGFEAINKARDAFKGPLAGEQASQDFRALQTLVGEAMQMMGGGLTFMPPDVDVETEGEWFTPSETVGYALQATAGPVDRELRVLAALEAMEHSKGDRQVFRTELEKLHTEVVAMAKARGEYGKIPLEVSFYRADYFTNALVFFLLGFLLVAVSWLVRPNRWLQLGIWLSTGAGAALVVTGITMRCIIRSRPPVSSLYETIIFIAAACVIVAMFIEWINRQRVALALATMLGAGGMFLSMKYELQEAVTAGDTMPSLVAVLDTNFWLATHVTTITLGYAAGLLAAAIAHVWLLGKMFGLRKGDKTFYKSISQMTYGAVCFGLLFTVVGTMLGGVWANYSWGRFWGWDPKENAALMICLWQTAMIQARLGGYIRDRGLAVGSVILGGVVVFSWWGVNLLNSGLHSYGDIPGLLPILLIFAAVESLVLVATGGAWLVARMVSVIKAARMASTSA